MFYQINFIESDVIFKGIIENLIFVAAGTVVEKENFLTDNLKMKALN